MNTHPIIGRRYRIEKRLGRGAFGEVFLAEDLLSPGRMLALKTRRIDPYSTSDARAALANEFRILTRVRHPNLARVYDLGLSREPGAGLAQIYFTRQYVDGVDIVEALKGCQGEQALEAAAILCHALATVHDLGIIHGDLAPTNVLGAKNQIASLQIIDFGLAANLGPADSSQLSGIQGTLAYVAPEMLRGATISMRTDLYALGALLHHALAGEPPFRGSPATVIQMHLDVPPPDLTNFRPDLPEELVAVVRRLLAKDPTHRYATAWDALRDLEGTLDRFSRPIAEAPLLGRDAELAVLERLVRPGSEPRIVAIVGDDSSGRTRLLEAIRWRIELSGRAEVAEINCKRDLSEPLGAVLELLHRVALFSEEEVEDPEIQTVLDGGNPEDLERFLPLLAAYVVKVLRSRPIVLLVDDLHLAAEPLIATLTHVVRRIEEAPDLPPLVIASRAGSRLDAMLSEVERSERIALAELDEAETERMVAFLVGESHPKLAQRIRAHASGLPGYVEEVTRAVLERGEDLDEESLPLPTGIEAAVHERIARLSPRERVVLDLAAVAGEPIGWEDVRDSPRGMKNEDFLSVARDLCNLGFLVEAEEETFSFVRSAVREAVYAACPLRNRRKLHAAHLEKIAPDDGDPPEGERLVVAAMHALRAQSRGQAAARAVKLTLAAAQYLARQGAHTFGVQLLRIALSQAKNDLQRQVRLALAEGLATTGDYRAAVELFEAVAHDAEGEESGEAWALAGGVLERQGAYDEAAKLIDRGLQCGLSGEVASEAQSALARVHLARGAYSEAKNVGLNALELATSATLRARTMAIVGMASSYLGVHKDAIELLERAREQAAEAQDLATEAHVTGHLAIAYSRAGRQRDSANAYQKAADLADQGGDLGSLPAHLMNLGTTHHGLGEYSKALELYRRATRLARRMGKQSVVVASLVNLADLYVHLGAAEEGRKTALKALLLAQRRGMSAFEARALQALAECAALQSPAAGVEDAEKAARLFETLGIDSRAAEARLVAAELMIWAGEPGSASVVVQKALAQAQNAGDERLLARARLVLTETRIARGETQGCQEVLEDIISDQTPLEQEDEVRWRAVAALGELAARKGESTRASRLDHAALEMIEAATGRVPPEYRESIARHPARKALIKRVKPGSASDRVTEDRVFRLMEVNRAVLVQRDPRRLLALALDTAIELCGAERGFLITLDAQRAVKVEVARNLDKEGIRSARLKVSRSIAEEVARTGVPLLTINASEDERFAHFTSVRELRLRSVMCVPIRGREQTLGTLYLDNRFESARFGEADLKLLLAFSDVVAVALENARLNNENERKAAELEEAKAQLEATSDQQARQLQTALRELEATREALGLKYDYSQIIGQSPGMLRVFQVLDRIIDTHVPVLIHGESGTGKELIARAVHFNGPRKTFPFISVNCGAIPESLLESELFGHVRGAFTGATTDREGLLPAAHQGTLFLDEIGDMSLAMQTKLLRALQEGEVRPVGATEDLHVDVRVVAASHRDLSQEVAEGRFREDLYYRVNVVRINLPPLRERGEDVPVLAEHILERCAGELGGSKKRLTPGAIEQLLRHDWPGNVRELENLLKNAAVLCASDVIDAADIPLTTTATRTCSQEDTLNLAELERQAIERAIAISSGNKKKASELLGIARLTLYRKLKSYSTE